MGVIASCRTANFAVEKEQSSQLTTPCLTYFSSSHTNQQHWNIPPPFPTSLHARASRCGSMDASPRISGLENTSLVPASINISPLSSQWSCSHILQSHLCRGLSGLSFFQPRLTFSSGQGTCSDVPGSAR